MFNKMEQKITKFYERTMTNYENQNTEEEGTANSTPHQNEDDDDYKSP